MAYLSELLLSFYPVLLARTYSNRPAQSLTMKRIPSPEDVRAPGASGAYSDKKQRTTMSDPTSTRVIPLESINQGSANTDSLDLEPSDLKATNSVTYEDSTASECECSPADKEENESDQKDLSYLCNRCLEVDFDNIFSRQKIEKGGDFILWFYSKHKLLHDPRCAFCQAMQFIYPSLDILPKEKKRQAPLVAAAIQECSADAGRERNGAWDATEENICLTFAHDEKDGSFEYHIIDRWIRKNKGSGLEHSEADLVGYLAEERTIEADEDALPAASIKPKVNFGMIRRRLQECRDEHDECRSKRGGHIQKVPGMRLIDCRTRTVVPAPEGNISYAALSYAWGNSTNDFSVENGHHRLPENLPNTILDAILVTRKLKIRYLWIDRYCIRQVPGTKEEKDEKHGQIARMHHIYGRASITIIAAAGDGPYHGLPGVRMNRRSPPIVRLPHRTLFATLPDPKLLVDTSAWSTRGWTFQEGLLARRRLVFTDQQVYFECSEIGVAEAWEECHEDMFKVSIVSPEMPLYPYFSLGNGRYPSVWLRIDDYANLKLGDPQDILNGILGVLTHYEGLSTLRQIAGLPVLWPYSPNSWPKGLADALSWECDAPGERRPGFPTWSWTGWTCKGFKRNDKFGHLPTQRIRPWKASVERHKEKPPIQSDLAALLDGRHDLSQIKSLYVTAPYLEVEIIPMDGIPQDQHYSAESHHAKRHRWNADGFDNNERKLGVRYSGVEKVSFINLTDLNWLKSPLPCGKTRCSAIMVDEDRLDIPNDQLGENERSSLFQSSLFRRLHSTALIVIEKENGFEKVGVSGVDRHALRQAGSVFREFRLI